MHDRAMVAERMLTTRARALTSSQRATWTIEPPQGWWFSDTAEQRLARRDRFRDAGYAV